MSGFDLIAKANLAAAVLAATGEWGGPVEVIRALAAENAELRRRHEATEHDVCMWAERCQAVERELAKRDAAPAAGVPDGWVLVPRKPTTEMAKRAWRTYCYGTHGGEPGMHSAIAAALAAAPTKEA